MVPDGSAFVSAGSANPTTTIAAVALRAADRLLARRNEVPRPAHRRQFTVPALTAPVSPDPVEAPPLPLSPAERDRLQSIADELVPEAEGMPAASSVGVAGRGVDQVLRARPDLAPALHDALGEEHLTDAQWATLRYVVAAAYYLAPEVHDALGYHPDRVTPVRPDMFPEYVAEGLLDHLLEPMA
jgi:hypothetical protein